jgi:hypothetical protein
LNSPRPRLFDGIPARQILLLGGLAALSLGVYVLASAVTYRVGFPLDDAWIHQTYARNLALRGEWSFIPGEPSTGSTAPIWSALLVVGQWAGGGKSGLWLYAWTYLLGWLALWGTAAIGAMIFPALCPENPKWAFWAGALMVFEWHLAWAAGSGMETLLFGLLILLSLGMLTRPHIRWGLLGLVIGLSVWARPDGLTLLGPAGLVLLLQPRGWRNRLADAVSLGAGLAGPVIAYLGFNVGLSGTFLPATFFAKQAEYAVLRETPLILRLAQQAGLPLVGAGALLLPGALVAGIRGGIRRKWGVAAGVIWAAGYMALYALRLPVDYQHGRYVMPVIPVLVTWGAAGYVWFDWVAGAKPAVAGRVTSRVWGISLALVGLIFWGRGALAYAQDTAVIETEMAAAAEWVAHNTPPQALIAAHDIGALGYFSGRRLVDLAGLATPEVIPFIRDEARLSEYLDARQVDVLVTFPSWYSQLTVGRDLLYRTDGKFSPALGGDHMSVYRWRNAQAQRLPGSVEAMQLTKP